MTTPLVSSHRTVQVQFALTNLIHLHPILAIDRLHSVAFPFLLRPLRVPRLEHVLSVPRYRKLILSSRLILRHLLIPTLSQPLVLSWYKYLRGSYHTTTFNRMPSIPSRLYPSRPMTHDVNYTLSSFPHLPTYHYAKLLNSNSLPSYAYTPHKPHNLANKPLPATDHTLITLPS